MEGVVAYAFRRFNTRYLAAISSSDSPDHSSTGSRFSVVVVRLYNSFWDPTRGRHLVSFSSGV
jgi:hypothetical protein